MTEEVLFRRARKAMRPPSPVRIDAACCLSRPERQLLDHLKPEESVKLREQVLEASSDAACTFVAESGGEIIGLPGMTLADRSAAMPS
jgi:hypothetical protein